MKLEDRLVKVRLQHHTLLVRVDIANQLISNTMWYMLQVWLGEITQLEAMDGKIKDFIWSWKE